MASRNETLARRVCKSAHRFMHDRPNQWVSVHDICQELKIPRDRTIDEAILYAVQRGWLTISPPPVHSVLLTADGHDLVRGKLRRMDRASK